MLNDISVGRYYDTSSIIHKANPIIKTIFLIVFSCYLFINTKLNVTVSFSMITLMLIILSKIEIRYYLKQLNSIKFFILFLFIINYIFKTPLDITFNIVLQIINLMFISSLILFTTKIKDITYALESILKPLRIIKINPSVMIFIITLSIRYIPIIFEQSKRILKALKARGLDYESNSYKVKIDAISTLLIPLFVLSLKRADKVSDALEVRHYNTDRTSYETHKYSIFDTLFVLIIITIIILERVII